MPLFSYTARDGDNKTVRGTMDAASLQAARAALMEMKLQPDEIHEALQSEQDTSLPDQSDNNSNQQNKCDGAPKLYFPITDTFRLYAGWLLAGYFVAYILGQYQLTKPLPFQIPYVLAFLYSPLILSFTLAAFLYLLATSIHKQTKGGFWKGILLAGLAVVAFVLFRINT
ncbi:hypothetical protein KKF55_04210 [Patescibacteria group bacterium]|nr:hypothetical protein [Patescibacteria group bacterium]